MTPRGLVVLGCGGHARSTAELALATGIPALLFADAAARPAERMLGFDVVAVAGALAEGWKWFAAAGDNAARQRQLAALAPADVHTLVAPDARVGTRATLGHGVFVGHFCFVGPLAVVGDGTIVNNGAIVEHDCKVGRWCHVSVHATLAGRVTLGERVFVGAGATVIDGVAICDDVLVGAGATVTEDVAVAGTYVGTPARRLMR